MPLKFQSKEGIPSRFFRAVGSIGILLILLLAWLSADPEAHEHFHHDADHQDHHCVVTDFALGEAFFLAPVILIPPDPVEYEAVQVAAIEFPRDPIAFRLLPSCGPPV